MIKLAIVTLALTLLTACASVGSANGFVAPPTSFDEGAAPAEPMATGFVGTLDRRRFSSPGQRQQELRIILATVSDRARRQYRRRRRAAA